MAQGLIGPEFYEECRLTSTFAPLRWFRTRAGAQTRGAALPFWLAVAVSLLSAQGARAEVAENWLLGGRWVREGTACFAVGPGGREVPQGVEFTSNKVRIWLPAEMGITSPQQFSADYQTDGDNLAVRLRRQDGQVERLAYRRLNEDAMQDLQGPRMRRCADNPTS